jgi:hypothetical protein
MFKKICSMVEDASAVPASAFDIPADVSFKDE